MSAHKHAALMALYAQDAMETDKPYERWEFKRGSSEWRPFTVDHPSWDEDCEYRRKTPTINTIRIGEYDVPKPVRGEDFPMGKEYWVADISSYTLTKRGTWYNTWDDQMRCHRGLIHLTREAAELHGRALAALTEIKS